MDVALLSNSNHKIFYYSVASDGLIPVKVGKQLMYVHWGCLEVKEIFDALCYKWEFEKIAMVLGDY